MDIRHGITGNKYVLGTQEELQNICDRIGKSVTAIHVSDRYNCFVMRLKSKHHKQQLKAIENELQTVSN